MVSERPLFIKLIGEGGIIGATPSPKQDSVHSHRRFDDLRNTALRLYIPVASTLLGAMVKYLLSPSEIGTASTIAVA